MSYNSKSKKSERVYQLRFNETFTPLPALDVTPQGFTGLFFDKGKDADRVANGASRFVREVVEEVAIKSTDDAGQYLLTKIYAPFEEFDQEELWVLLLNNKHRITHETMVYRGTVNSITVRPVEMLKEAVRVNAPAVIVSHCHPSGSAEPSPEDFTITDLVNQAAVVLGINLLDHIVVGKNCWVSLKERLGGDLAHISGKEE